MFELTIPHILFDYVIWFLFFILNRHYFSVRINRIPKESQMRVKNYRLFFILASLFCTYGFVNGDYGSYKVLYENIGEINGKYEGAYLEPFYMWLIDVLPESYDLWRFVVWGASVVVMILIFKRLKLSVEFSSLIFGLLLFVYFAALRNSLGYVVLYLGATYLLFPDKNKNLSYVVGIALIICSYFLHKSMFLYITLFFVALIPMGRYLFYISIPLFPILYKSINYFSTLFFTNSIANEQSLESAQHYLDSEFQRNYNLLGYFHLAIWRLPVLILLGLSISQIFFKHRQVPYVYKVLLKISYFLVYISFLFWEQKVSGHLSIRFYYAAIYPLVIFLSYYLYTTRSTRVIKLCLYTLVFANFFDLLYSIYKVY